MEGNGKSFSTSARAKTMKKLAESNKEEQQASKQAEGGETTN
jgi:hypothetical protein